MRFLRFPRFTDVKILVVDVVVADCKTVGSMYVWKREGSGMQVTEACT